MKYFWLSLSVNAVPFMYKEPRDTSCQFPRTSSISCTNSWLEVDGGIFIIIIALVAMHYYVNSNQRSSRLSAMDKYLSTLGLWRKPIARDGFCLFRATSEQVSWLCWGYLRICSGNLQSICRVVIHVFCDIMQINVLLINWIKKRKDTIHTVRWMQLMQTISWTCGPDHFHFI